MSELLRSPDIGSTRATWLVLAGSIAACLVLQTVSIFTREINWDEFFYLSHVYSFSGGTLTRALQTAHAVLFFWLPMTGGNEISQVEIGRCVMMAFQLMTCTCIFLIALRFFESGPALFAVLAYITSSYVLDHGSSFRADPIAASLAMISLSVLLLSGLRFIHITIAAAAMALAALVTVKAVFYAPAFLAVGIWRLTEKDPVQPNLVRLTSCLLLAVGFFLAGYFALIAIMPSADHSGSEALMASAAENTIGLMTPAGFVRLLRTILASPISWLVIAGGMSIAVGHLRSLEYRNRALLFLALASPIFSLAIYRNSFPYFYPFILPPATLLAAYSANWLGRQQPRLTIANLLMVFTSLLYWTSGLGWTQNVQNVTVEEVHRLFPRPVAYIDRNSMISSFQKRGPFMSMWGLRAYVAKGRPVFAEILQIESVPLLIANSSAIEVALGIEPTSEVSFRLLTDDEAVLRNNYIHYWGAIWIAGKDLSLKPGCNSIVIAIPGRYLLHSTKPVSINALALSTTAKVVLNRGKNEVCSKIAQKISLKWAVQPPKLGQSPPPGPVYRGFR